MTSPSRKKKRQGSGSKNTHKTNQQKKKNKPNTAHGRGNPINQDIVPPTKTPQFTANQTDGDAYLNEVHTTLGPKGNVPHWQVILKCMECGPRLRGYTKVEFALPYTQEQIMDMAREMEERAMVKVTTKEEKKLKQKQGEWILPSFNITGGIHGRQMAQMVGKVKNSYIAGIKNERKETQLQKRKCTTGAKRIC